MIITRTIFSENIVGKNTKTYFGTKIFGPKFLKQSNLNHNYNSMGFDTIDINLVDSLVTITGIRILSYIYQHVFHLSLAPYLTYPRP